MVEEGALLQHANREPSSVRSKISVTVTSLKSLTILAVRSR